jgi:hypothetical protein
LRPVRCSRESAQAAVRIDIAWQGAANPFFDAMFLCMHYTVHMIRFPDVALKRTGEMPAAGTACARTQIQRNSCNLPLILIPRSDRGTGFGEDPDRGR